MGWKSTKELTRREAIQAIMSVIEKTPYDDMTNEELENVMYGLGMGDELDLPYFGYNFTVLDKLNEEEDEK